MRAIALLAVLIGVSLADEEYNNYKGPSQQDVITLDADNLQPTIYQSQDPWLIDLHAPWCDHCKKLRPEWAKLATRLKGIAKVSKVDASIYRKFDQVYNLKGYPHIVLVPAGAKDKAIYQTYDGSRTVDALQQWALERINKGKGFLVQRLTSEQKFKTYCTQIGASACIIVIVPHILDSSQQERAVYFQIIKNVANNFRDKPVSFMWAQANDHKQFEQNFALHSGYPIAILLNPIKQIYSIMRSSFSEENFEEWLKELLTSRRPSKHLGKYSKSLVFGQVEEQEELMFDRFQEIDANDQDQFTEEL